MGVREPAADRNGVLRVEDVTGRRVIDDDGVLEIPAQVRKILRVKVSKVRTHSVPSVRELPSHSSPGGCSSSPGTACGGRRGGYRVDPGVGHRTDTEKSAQRKQEHPNSSTHLRHGCREHDNLVKLADTLHELIDPRSLDNVDIMIRPFDLDGNRKVGLLQQLQKRSVKKYHHARKAQFFFFSCTYFETAMH